MYNQFPNHFFLTSIIVSHFLKKWQSKILFHLIKNEFLTIIMISNTLISKEKEFMKIQTNGLIFVILYYPTHSMAFPMFENIFPKVESILLMLPVVPLLLRSIFT
jgi:hypothetical protein